MSKGCQCLCKYTVSKQVLGEGGGVGGPGPSHCAAVGVCYPSKLAARELSRGEGGTHIPAALAAAMPEGASSNTRQLPGSGAGSNCDAARRKMSGAGLPLVTRSPAWQ
jgi:hypothetical protein